MPRNQAVACAALRSRCAFRLETPLRLVLKDRWRWPASDAKAGIPHDIACPEREHGAPVAAAAATCPRPGAWPSLEQCRIRTVDTKSHSSIEWTQASFGCLVIREYAKKLRQAGRLAPALSKPKLAHDLTHQHVAVAGACQVPNPAPGQMAALRYNPHPKTVPCSFN